MYLHFKSVIVVVVLAVLAGGLVLLGQATTTDKPGGPVACTADAKLCPDGSAVGRVGPNCEFAECPRSNDNTVSTREIGKEILINGLGITPLMVTQDSRCPTDVTCVWAGTVELRVKLMSADSSEEVVLTLGTPHTFGTKQITLQTVRPAPNSEVEIKPGDYKFTFSVVDVAE